MSDEELIEKAARAILDAEGIEPEEDGTYWGTGTWPNAVKDARACLAVFREHTAPTDDDREALAQVLLAWAGPWEGPRKPSLLELLLAAGFRRGAPTEPAVTNEQVEAARIAIHVALAPRWMSVVDALAGDQGDYEGMLDTLARAALEAALNTQRGEGDE